MFVPVFISATLFCAHIVVVPASSEPQKSATETQLPKQKASCSRSKRQRDCATTALQKSSKPTFTMDQFLDRLMIAESGGNDQARNSMSTATGPYQFIESTFLSVMQRHFPKRIEELNEEQILALRTNRSVARDAAQAYTRDNATYLVAAGHKPTFPHLRLAFLLGADGAIRVLGAKPLTPVITLLRRSVIRANPWMVRHTAQSLIARAASDVSLEPTSPEGAKPFRSPATGKLVLPGRGTLKRPRIRILCNLARPSCKRWLALRRRSLEGKQLRKDKLRKVHTSKR